MFAMIIFALSIIKIIAAFNDFPSLMIANATMAVVIERPFFELKAVKRRHTTRNAYEKKLETFVKSITEAAKSRSVGSNVGIEINVFQETNVNLAKDYTVLLSVASCQETWSLFEKARREKLVHLAITDHDCPRLPIANGVSIPIVEPGQELAQMLLDLRVERIFSWNKINVIYDRVFDFCSVAWYTKFSSYFGPDCTCHIFLHFAMFDPEGICRNSCLNAITERDTIGRVLRALSNEIPNVPHVAISSHCFFSAKLSNNSSSMSKRILETLRNFLPHRRRMNDRFFLIVESDLVPIVLENARSLNMLRPENQWLFILPDSSENPSKVSSFNRLLAEGENVAFIYNVTNFHEDCRNGEIPEVGLECHAKEMVRSLSSAVENALRREIELYENITEEEFDVVRPTKAERCREFVTFIREDLFNSRSSEERTKKCNDCMMWEMLTGITWGNSFDAKNKSEPHELINIGYWTPDRGSQSTDLLFPHEKYGFRGKSLPLVTYHNPPWQYVAKSEESGEFEWDGLTFDIVDELSKKLNFTYKLLELGATTTTTRPARSKNLAASGNRSDTGGKEKEFLRALTSSGGKIPDEVLEFVRNGSVLMAASASTIIERLKSTVNFTLPISVQTYGLLARRPKPLSRAMLFASPYTTESWACLAGAVLLTGPILYLVHRYSPSPSNDLSGRVYLGLSTPARCLWYIYGALLQQGGMHLPDNDGARLIVGTWWLVVMIIVATYSGSLVAFLTFPRMHESISSIDDLLRHKDTLTWSLPARSFLLEYLANGKNGPYDGLLGDEARLPETHDFDNYETIVDRVKSGTHVLIDWTSSLRMLAKFDNPLIDDETCHFSIGTQAFLEESIALFLPMNTPYLGLINTQLKRMNEAGLIAKWTRNRVPMRDECWEGPSMNNEVNNHKVDVWDMQGIFFVLILGYLVSSVFLGWEFLSHYRRLARERRIIRPFRS